MSYFFLAQMGWMASTKKGRGLAKDTQPGVNDRGGLGEPGLPLQH